MGDQSQVHAGSGARRWATTGVAAVTAVLLTLTACGAAAHRAGQNPTPDSPPTPASTGVDPGPARLVTTQHTDGATCGDYLIAVTEGPQPVVTAATAQHMAVRVCSHSTFTNRPVQVLLPALGYDGRAWTLGPDYVRAATRAGYVTAQVDLLGTGDPTRPLGDGSSHPTGSDLTYTIQAWAVHTLLQDLRAGVLGLIASASIVVGQGTGGYIADLVANQWPGDLAGVVVLDAPHRPDQPTRAALEADLHPARDDPRFQAADWAAQGYLTLSVGARCALFYYQPDSADTATCRQDENLFGSEGVPVGELTSLNDLPQSAISTGIHLPVLLVFGDHDTLACGHITCSAPTSAIQTECATWYPVANAARLCATVFIPAAGVNALQQASAKQKYPTLTDWIHQTFLRAGLQ